MDVLHRLSDVDSIDDGFGFNLIDSESEPLIRFAYDTEQDARQGARFMQGALDKAVGILPAGPF